MIMRCQRRPETVDAIRWDGTQECLAVIQKAFGNHVIGNFAKVRPVLMVGQKRASVGDVVFRNNLGIMDVQPYEVFVRMFGEATEGAAGVDAARLEEMIAAAVEARAAKITQDVTSAVEKLIGEAPKPLTEEHVVGIVQKQIDDLLNSKPKPEAPTPQNPRQKGGKP